MYLIALTGAKESGKDTAFTAIEEWSRGRGLLAVRRAFADALKKSVAEVLNMQFSEVDYFKENGWVKVSLGADAPTWTLSGREILQRYGTEAHREIFGDDFWVEELLPRDFGWQDNFREDFNIPLYPDFGVITDCRFDNEAARVKELGGVVWEIIRPTDDQSDDHASEAGVSPRYIDLIIDNDDTLEQFKTRVVSAMVGEYHMKILTRNPD
jgi:hypothetical protein